MRGRHRLTPLAQLLEPPRSGSPDTKGEANVCRRMPGRVASAVLRRAVGEDRAASPKPKIAISHPMLELRT